MVLTIYACDKIDIVNNFSDTIYPISVNEAQEWFTNKIKNVKISGGKQKRFDLAAVDWKEAIKTKYQKGRETIEIPLRSKNIKKYKLNTKEYNIAISKLIIFRDKEGNITSNIVDILIDNDELV